MLIRVTHTIYERDLGLSKKPKVAGITIPPTPSVTGLELDHLIEQLVAIRNEMDTDKTRVYVERNGDGYNPIVTGF